MLDLHKSHLHLPHPTFHMPHQMQLSTVPVDTDELAVAIENQLAAQDDDWQLEERPDTDQLVSFWTAVTDDVANDPDWNTFAED